MSWEWCVGTVIWTVIENLLLNMTDGYIWRVVFITIDLNICCDNVFFRMLNFSLKSKEWSQSKCISVSYILPLFPLSVFAQFFDIFSLNANLISLPLYLSWLSLSVSLVLPCQFDLILVTHLCTPFYLSVLPILHPHTTNNACYCMVIPDPRPCLCLSYQDWCLNFI